MTFSVRTCEVRREEMWPEMLAGFTSTRFSMKDWCCGLKTMVAVVKLTMEQVER